MNKISEYRKLIAWVTMLTLLIAVNLGWFTYVAAQNELKIVTITEESEVNDAISGAEPADGIIFTKDITLTNNYVFTKPNFQIIVNPNVTVTCTSKGAVFKSAKGLVIENKGTMNFDGVNRAIYVSGGDLKIVSEEAGTINIKNYTGYAIAAEGASNVLIKNQTITTNSTSDNVESAVFLGNKKTDSTRVIGSKLNLTNNSNHPYSSAFMSMAQTVEFSNSKLNTTSKAHYKFNVYGAKDQKQTVVFNNTSLDIITPADAKPIKSYLGLEIPVFAVGINATNTQYTINPGSSIKYESEYKDHKGLELNKADIIVDGGSLTTPSLGFDNNHKEISTFVIKCGSRVTVDKVTADGEMPNIQGRFTPTNPLPEITVHGDTASFPLDDAGDLEVDFGEGAGKTKITKIDDCHVVIEEPTSPVNPIYLDEIPDNPIYLDEIPDVITVAPAIPVEPQAKPVVNVQPSKLPATGEQGHYTIYGILASLLAVALVIYKKSR